MLWLLPAATQSAVELDEGQGFALLCGRQIQLGGVEIRGCGQNLQVAGRTTFIPHPCEASRILSSCNKLLLLLTIDALLVQGNQSVRGIAKGSGDCLLVVEHHLQLSRLGQVQLPAELAACKDRLSQRAETVDGLGA